MGPLSAVALPTGVLTLCFDVAVLSSPQGLVGREEVVEEKARPQASASTAQVVGRGVAGGLIQAVGAPVALVVDAASFLLSGLLLTRIRPPESAPDRAAEAHVWREIGEGWRVVGRNPTLRAQAASLATVSLFA